jgi:hypothetical protein
LLHALPGGSLRAHLEGWGQAGGYGGGRRLPEGDLLVSVFRDEQLCRRVRSGREEQICTCPDRRLKTESVKGWDIESDWGASWYT